MADSRTSESKRLNLVKRRSWRELCWLTANGTGVTLPIFFTRTSARCPVAARTRMSTSVDTPCVFPFAMAVTRLRDVPAQLDYTDATSRNNMIAPLRRAVRSYRASAVTKTASDSVSATDIPHHVTAYLTP